MKLHLLNPLVLDTRSWKVVEIRTWEATISLFVQERTGTKKLIGIVTDVLPLEDHSQSNELEPYTSVSVEIFEDFVSIEKRS